MVGTAAAIALMLVPAAAHPQTPRQARASRVPASRHAGCSPAASQPRAPGLLGMPPPAARGAGPPRRTPVRSAGRRTPPPLPSDRRRPAAAGLPRAGAFDAAAGAARPQTRRLVLTVHQLGALGPLTLRGTSELQGVQFGIRADEVVTGATLNLSGAMSPALIPEFSNVTVTLNEQYVGTIPVNRDQPRFENFDLPSARCSSRTTTG